MDWSDADGSDIKVGTVQHCTHLQTFNTGETMFNKKIRCDRCKENYELGTLNAASVDHYKKCLPCCMATQTSYDPAVLGVVALQQRPPEEKTTMNERVFMVRIVSDGKRPIKDLSDHVANRIWSLDGVLSATATEVK